MEAARLIAIGQIKQAEKEICKLQGTKNNSSLMWWEAVKFASQNILEGLEHDIEFREAMMYQEELEKDRPIDVQI